jgi:hypothetical protein
MKLLFLAALGLCLTAPAAAAYEDEGLPEAVISTDTARSEDEEDQPQVQETDEDLAAFVTDYIRKDILLKGAFFLEELPSRKILKLELASVAPKASGSENGARAVTVTFKDAANKKRTALFWLQGGPWGGLDIFKIELKTPGVKPAPELKPAPARRKN